MGDSRTERLTVDLLGGFQVRGSTGAVVDFRSRRASALFAYLALHPGQAVSRDKLAGLLWGDRPDARARGNLRQALASLRRILVAGSPNPHGEARAIGRTAMRTPPPEPASLRTRSHCAGPRRA